MEWGSRRHLPLQDHPVWRCTNFGGTRMQDHPFCNDVFFENYILCFKRIKLILQVNRNSYISQKFLARYYSNNIKRFGFFQCILSDKYRIYIILFIIVYIRVCTYILLQRILSDTATWLWLSLNYPQLNSNRLWCKPPQLPPHSQSRTNAINRHVPGNSRPPVPSTVLGLQLAHETIVAPAGPQSPAMGLPGHAPGLFLAGPTTTDQLNLNPLRLWPCGLLARDPVFRLWTVEYLNFFWIVVHGWCHRVWDWALGVVRLGPVFFQADHFVLCLPDGP